MGELHLVDHDALLIVDVQRDFLEGGPLAVPGSDDIIPILNEYIRMFTERALPVLCTRDWHPEQHCSFRPHGGIWPPHCVARTSGAEFPSELKLPKNTLIVSKATRADCDAYSGFEGTDLEMKLRTLEVQRLFVGGLATDYCVMQTVIDGLRRGFAVWLLQDASRAVDLVPGDGIRAIAAMKRLGANVTCFTDMHIENADLVAK